VNGSIDGREQVVGLHFKGDWLGFDGIALGRHGCEAVAIDTGEIWSLRYDDLLLSRLARASVMRFPEKGRRDIQIPEVGALHAFIERCTATPAMMH
jgi:CRP-like cAMP-binding protein